MCGINCINWLNNSKLLREKNSTDYYGKRICDSLTDERRSCIEINTMMIEFRCQQRCQPNCQQVHYDFEVIKYVQIHRMSQPWNVLSLRFVHRDGPDMVIIHRPTMKWIELVSSFGGLSGMWLGISFVLILDHLVKAISLMNI